MFRAQSNDGNTYNAALGALQNQLTAADVPAGRQVRGQVAFDAPAGPLLVDYTAILGAPLVTFNVPG